MQVTYKRPFAQYIKKAHKPLQLAILDAVECVCSSPDLGELKLGDLAGVRIYKFRFNRQEYLMAYRFLEESDSPGIQLISFYQVGSHENFYEGLKKYLRQVGA